MNSVFSLRLTLAACSLFACVACLGNTEKGDASVLARDQASVLKVHPKLDLALMLRFYEEYSPDLLREWRRRSVERPGESGAYLKRLTDHFLELEAIRLSDVAEYQRLLEYETLQGRVRDLSGEIRRLVKLGEDLLSQETEELRQSSLRKAKADLKRLLERSFDESLRQQHREIDKLEFELVELRQLIDERKKNRNRTIRDSFHRLTGGQSFPED